MMMNVDAILDLIQWSEKSGVDTNLLESAKKQLDAIGFNLVGYARLNDRGDVYSYRSIPNPYLDQDTVVNLYVNNQEINQKYSRISNA